VRGHISRRGTGWQVVYDEGQDEHGKRRQRSKSGFATRREAQAFLTDTLGRLGNGSYATPSQLTVSEYLAGEWLPAAERRLRPLSVKRYRSLIRTYIVPGIGSVKLQALSPGHLNGCMPTSRRPGCHPRPSG
jgi:hypothetical protein